MTPIATGALVVASHLTKTIAFLSDIGIPMIADEKAGGFVEHVLIANGALRYHPIKAQPSNLLHEAGHLAVVPERFRHLAYNDMDDLFEIILEDYGRRHAADVDFDHDAIENRAVMQCSETEATAWAFAAGRAIGLPDEVTILDDEYDNEGASVRLQLQCSAYLGINGLVAGQMCQKVSTYPTLTRWLQI